MLRRCAGADHHLTLFPLLAAHRIIATNKVKTTSNSAAVAPRKSGNATIKDFYNAVCERYEGELKYRDSSNLKLPLRSCDIDGLKLDGGNDAARPERAGNFRLFFGPFNDIRSDAVDDRYPCVYIAGVKKNFRPRRTDRERAEELETQGWAILDDCDDASTVPTSKPPFASPFNPLLNNLPYNLDDLTTPATRDDVRPSLSSSLPTTRVETLTCPLCLTAPPNKSMT